MSQAFAAAPSLQQRMLVLYGAHDEIVPPGPTEKFIAALPEASAQTRVVAYYDDGYHMLLRDLEGPIVQRDVQNWIFAPQAPLPSGADHRGNEVLVSKN